jgi:hypothetical protein
VCEKALRTELTEIVEAAAGDAAASVIFVECTSASLWPWVTPVILLLSVAVATFGVITARGIARQRATIDFIEKFESSPHYKDLRATFRYYHRKDALTGTSALSNPKETSDKDARTKVLDYLNHYEIVSIGLARGILDKKIYYDWMRGAFIRDWQRAKHFIQRERWDYNKDTKDWVYYDRAYARYETMVLELVPDEPKLTKDFSGPPERFDADSPSDELTPNPDNPIAVKPTA